MNLVYGKLNTAKKLDIMNVIDWLENWGIHSLPIYIVQIQNERSVV